MRAVIRSDGTELASNVVAAESLFSRMKGLLGRDSLAAGEGLWIRPCNGVHTFGMRFPIDVVFLDKRMRVLKVITNLMPNRVTRVLLNGASVLELPAHATRGIVASGDVIEFTRTPEQAKTLQV